MAEQLLLRKGSLANLSTLDKVPGAISITTDVPGIYLDVDANTRIRIGDFITVADLAQLNQLAKTGLSETALYYVESDNILARYSATANDGKPGLVWINDTTAIENDIIAIQQDITNNVKQDITNLKNAVEEIKNVLGQATTGHKATHALDTSGDATTTVKTVYKSIEDEYDRATGAESNLQSQIDTIKGNGTGSLGALEAKLDQEIENRAQSDTALGNRITNEIGALAGEGNTSTVKQNADKIAAINTKLGENFETNAQVNTLEKITISAGQVSLGEKNPDGDKNITITIPQTLAHLEGATQTITDIQNTITKIYGGSGVPATGAVETISQNASDIDNINQVIGSSSDTKDESTVYGAIAAEKARAEKAESDIEQTITNLKNGSSSTIKSLDEEIAALKQADTNNNNTVSGINTRLIQAEQDIDSLQASVGYVKPTNGKSLKELLDEEIARASGAEQTLQGNINTLSGTVESNKTEAANAVKAEKERAEDQEAAIRQEFANADTALREDLLEEIETNIAAANSMRFMGPIYYDDIENDLNWPLSNVEAGDTYVVQTSGKMGEHDYHAGDLIVAKRDQLEDEIIYPTGTDDDGGWIHVETGYNEATQSKLTASDNQVILTSHAGTELGAVTFETPSSNLEITTNENNTIQVSLVWATF